MSDDVFDGIMRGINTGANVATAQNTAAIRQAAEQQAVQLQAIREDISQQRQEADRIAKASLWILEVDRSFNSLSPAARAFYARQFILLMQSWWQPQWFTKEAHVFDAYQRLKASCPAAADEFARQHEQKHVVAGISALAEIVTVGGLNDLHLFAANALQERLNKLSDLHAQFKAKQLGVPAAPPQMPTAQGTGDVPIWTIVGCLPIMGLVVSLIVGAIVEGIFLWLFGATRRTSSDMGGIVFLVCVALTILCGLWMIFDTVKSKRQKREHVRRLASYEVSVKRAMDSLRPDARAGLVAVDGRIDEFKRLFLKATLKPAPSAASECKSILTRHLQQYGLAEDMQRDGGDALGTFALFIDRLCFAEGLPTSMSSDLVEAYSAAVDSLHREGIVSPAQAVPLSGQVQS
jgi:hypothetical protein